MTSTKHFELLRRDGQARTGKLTTPHGVVRTPAFMPVGTAGAMKGLHWREVREAGTDIVLGNTYHLMLRPGAERIAELGGLQNFTGWRGPMPRNWFDQEELPGYTSISSPQVSAWRRRAWRRS